MSSLLTIKSKFSLDNIFDYIPYNLCLKIVFGSKKLLQKLLITKKTFQKSKILMKILKSSYDVRQYLAYLDSYNFNEENEKIVYGCLNTAPFNVSLYVGEEKWENLIKYVHNLNLMVTPNLLNYMYENNIFEILNRYRNNIVEITFCDFNQAFKINFEIIKHIINVLEKIFMQKYKKEKYLDIITEEASQISIKDISNNNNKIQKTHNIKKLSFEGNEILPYIDISDKLFDKINNIIPLNEINEIFVDTNSFSENQFSVFIKYISKTMSSLKNIKINNFGFNKSHYVNFSILFDNPREQIEILDLSNFFCSDDILSLLNIKSYPLKELKLKLNLNKGGKNSWEFFDKIIGTLEVLEFEFKEKGNNNVLQNIFLALNKMEILKHLKLIGDLEPKDITNFRKFQNIEYLNIDLNYLNKNNNVKLMGLNNIPVELYNYFTNFINLKTLIIENKSHIDKDISFKFPPKLKCLHLYNFEDYLILPIIRKNIINLSDIEDFKLEKSKFQKKTFMEFVDLFKSFKSLIKLSLNKIDIGKCFNAETLCEDYVLFESIPIIFKNAPFLIELDVSNNKYDEKTLKNDVFKRIKVSLPKKLFSLKVFNSDISVSENSFIHLNKLFGNVLNLDDNYPIISKGVDPNDIYNDDEFHENFVYMDDEYEFSNNY